MRIFKKLVVGLTLLVSGISMVGGCTRTPNGTRVLTYISDYPVTSSEPKLYDITSHKFNGQSKSGDFQYQYTPFFPSLLSGFLNLINLRSETKATDPPLPSALYDSAITGTQTTALIKGQTPKIQSTWKQFYASYNNTSVGYNFSNVVLAKVDAQHKIPKSQYKSYQRLALIPDYRALNGKNNGKYFKKNKAKVKTITQARATLVNFQTVANALTYLNQKALTPEQKKYQSNNNIIKQTARTALCRVGQAEVILTFAGQQRFQFSAWLDHLVARLELKSWTLDGKKYAQGWVFTGFDFYDYNFAHDPVICDPNYHKELPSYPSLILGFNVQPLSNWDQNLTASNKNKTDHSAFKHLTRRGKDQKIKSFQQYHCGVFVDTITTI